jgi:hypothetical protein
MSTERADIRAMPTERPDIRERELPGRPEVRTVTNPVYLEDERDRIRWGPIIAGFFTAMTTLLVLNVLGLAIGLTAVSPRAFPGQAGFPPDVATMSAAWAAIATVISFLLGGLVAGRTAAVVDRGMGALNGALVFVVAIPVTLWLAGQGIGTVLGGLAAFARELDVVVTMPAPGSMSSADVALIAAQVRDGALGVLVALALGLAAAGLGGALGTVRPRPRVIEPAQPRSIVA